MDHWIEIDGWKTGIRFSACHMLLRHDKCSRLHGHSYCIHLRVFGILNENRMLLDFGRIKKYLRSMADGMDHMILIPTENDDIEVLVDEEGGRVDVDMSGKRYSFPREDVKLLSIPTTTVEEMSKFLMKNLIDDFDFPRNVKRVELGIDEGIGQGGWSGIVLG